MDDSRSRRSACVGRGVSSSCCVLMSISLQFSGPNQTARLWTSDFEGLGWRAAGTAPRCGAWTSTPPKRTGRVAREQRAVARRTARSRRRRRCSRRRGRESWTDGLCRLDPSNRSSKSGQIPSSRATVVRSGARDFHSVLGDAKAPTARPPDRPGGVPSIRARSAQFVGTTVRPDWGAEHPLAPRNSFTASISLYSTPKRAFTRPSSRRTNRDRSF